MWRSHRGNSIAVAGWRVKCLRAPVSPTACLAGQLDEFRTPDAQIRTPKRFTSAEHSVQPVSIGMELRPKMKTNLALAGLFCGTTFLTGCAHTDLSYVDEEEEPAIRHVRVTTVSPGYYYGDFDEYTPYYSYGGRRYYRTSNRYVYYVGRQPYYVTALPVRSVYITPPRRRTTVAEVITYPDPRRSPDWPR